MEKVSTSEHFISLEEVERAILYLRSNNLISDKTVFHLYNWGEPFLHPDFEDIIDLLNSYDILFALSTNASIMRSFQKKEQFRNLVSIVFSMPGFSQQSYDKMHGFCFDIIRENMQAISFNLRECGFNGSTQISFHVYQFNQKEVSQIAQFASQHNFILNPFYAHICGLDMYRSYLKSEMDYELLRKASVDLLLYYIDEFRKKRPSDYTCPQINDILVIDEHCNVSTCCGIEKGMDGYLVGKLFDLSANKIIQQKRNQSFCDECRHLGLDYLIHNPFYVEHSLAAQTIFDGNGNVFPCILTVDSPTNEEHVHENEVKIRGWCLDGFGIDTIDILVDNVFDGKARYGFLRSDVRNAFLSYGNFYSGYEYDLDLSKLCKGTHIIQIIAYNLGSQSVKNAEVIIKID